MRAGFGHAVVPDCRLRQRPHSYRRSFPPSLRGIPDRLRVKQTLFRTQLEVLGRRIRIAVVKPRRQALRRREQVDEEMAEIAALLVGAAELVEDPVSVYSGREVSGDQRPPRRETVSIAFTTNPASEVLFRFELDGLNEATEALGGN